MDAIIKEKWIADLRSNPPKAIGRLEEYLSSKDRIIGHCCLGRLCVIMNAERDFETVDDEICFIGIEDDEPDWAQLPISIALTAGIDTKGTLPFLDRDGNLVTLAVANDFDCTFSQIADLIEYFF